MLSIYDTTNGVTFLWKLNFDPKMLSSSVSSAFEILHVLNNFFIISSGISAQARFI